MAEVQQLPKDLKADLARNQPDDEISSEETVPQQPRRDTTPKKLSIVTKVNPASSVIRRSLGFSGGGTVHPSPDSSPLNEAGEHSLGVNVSKDSNRNESKSWASESLFGENGKRKKQVASVYTLVMIPALLTIYRTYFANGGPTWFSFHPMMMMTAVVTMLGAMLCQFIGGESNMVRVGSLSFASVFSMFLGLYVVWTAKEMYAKTHFISMHSHFGGMAIDGIIVYALAAFAVYNPVKGTTRLSPTWQRRLITWGKCTATLGLTSMLIGIIEVERSWIMLFLWVSSLSLMLPFLILDWYKQH